MANLEINKELLAEIELISKNLQSGNNTSQQELDTICEKLQPYRSFLRPNEKDEIFNIVDSKGSLTKLTAPRWLCHLLGLRHRSVHVLLRWESLSLGKIFVLQVRSWNKSDSPGQLDISVGGHVLEDMIAVESAYREMEEELGIKKEDLFDKKLLYQKGYESTDIRQENYFYNTEWRDVFIGNISIHSLEKIRFKDNEVVGLYFCPELEAQNLLNQKVIPLASALRLSLPYCL